MVNRCATERIRKNLNMQMIPNTVQETLWFKCATDFQQRQEICSMQKDTYKNHYIPWKFNMQSEISMKWNQFLPNLQAVNYL